jgi:hypothetical protein
MNDYSWYHIGSQVRPYNDGTYDGFINEMYVNGVNMGKATTQAALELDVVGILQTDALFEISVYSAWEGYLDDVAVWNGYADDATWMGLYNGTYTPLTAPFIVPEPMTLTLLGLGAMLLRRKK